MGVGGGVEGRDITEGCNCKCRHISNKYMHQPEILHCVTDRNGRGKPVLSYMYISNNSFNVPCTITPVGMHPTCTCCP